MRTPVGWAYTRLVAVITHQWRDTMQASCTSFTVQGIRHLWGFDKSSGWFERMSSDRPRWSSRAGCTCRLAVGWNQTVVYGWETVMKPRSNCTRQIGGTVWLGCRQMQLPMLETSRWFPGTTCAIVTGAISACVSLSRGKKLLPTGLRYGEESLGFHAQISLLSLH